jgi:hypothetical protein
VEADLSPYKFSSSCISLIYNRKGRKSANSRYLPAHQQLN